MAKYILNRVLSIVPMLIIVSFVVFFIISSTPGGPASHILGMEASNEEIAQLNEKLGLNDPFLVQYGRWSINALKGDLGKSYFMEETVSEAIQEHFGPTIALAIYTEILSIFIAFLLGMLAAWKYDLWVDKIISAFSLLFLALPSFVSSLILVILFSITYKLFPVAGYAPIGKGLVEHLKFLTLPAIALAIPQIAVLTRIIRSSFITELNKNYINTSRINGASNFYIMFVEVFRNAMIPIVTAIGQSFGSLITGAIVVETVFAIPGLGQLLINSIERRDLNMIQGIVVVISVVYILLNLAIDISYKFIDKRIDIGGTHGNEN